MKKILYIKKWSRSKKSDFITFQITLLVIMFTATFMIIQIIEYYNHKYHILTMINIFK